MSTDLYWKPDPDDGNSLSDKIKHALSKRYGHGEFTMNVTDISYLNGLEDAGLTEASLLIDAITLYSSIKLWHQ